MGAEDYWKKPFTVLGLGKILEGYVAKKKVRAVTQTQLHTTK